MSQVPSFASSVGPVLRTGLRWLAAHRVQMQAGSESQLHLAESFLT
jgi:hypothetical protein